MQFSIRSLLLATTFVAVAAPTLVMATSYVYNMVCADPQPSSVPPLSSLPFHTNASRTHRLIESGEWLPVDPHIVVKIEIEEEEEQQGAVSKQMGVFEIEAKRKTQN